MVLVHTITNSIFKSQTYIIYRENCKQAWIVDIGDIEPVLLFLNEHQLLISGVILTHAHFDHIYGLKSLLFHYPQINIYVSDYSKRALASDKLNMSRYHGTPLSIESDRIVVVHDSDSLCLFADEPLMFFYETPGHNPGCLTMVIGNVIFTGDAYMPGIETNVRMPHSDKEAANKSLERIIKLADGKTVFPGHTINHKFNSVL